MITVNSSFACVVLILVLGCTGKDSSSTAEQDQYTCPMHPTVISDKQGACPVCGMDLVRKTRAGEEVVITEALSKVMKSPSDIVMSNIATVRGEYAKKPVSRAVQGLVTYDTRSIHTIPARVGGRLEKVLLKYAFQPVHIGDKVAEIYSPELLTAQRELLYLLEADTDNMAMIDAARNKLYLLGATRDQVDKIVARKEAMYTFSLYSPYEGYVIANDQRELSTVTPATSSSSAMGTGMGGDSRGTTKPSKSMSATPSEWMREGTYVSAGQMLFTIVDPTALRIELDVPATETGKVIEVQDVVDLDLGSQGRIQGKVDFVQPFFSEGAEFIKIRVYVRNTGELRIGQLVRGNVVMDSVEALWIPRKAVMDLGQGTIVFVKERGVFIPKTVKTGTQSGEWVAINQGLSSSDEFASNAQYLVDSESFIKRK